MEDKQQQQQFFSIEPPTNDNTAIGAYNCTHNENCEKRRSLLHFINSDKVAQTTIITNNIDDRRGSVQQLYLQENRDEVLNWRLCRKIIFADITDTCCVL
jgi:hypothetical protein